MPRRSWRVSPFGVDRSALPLDGKEKIPRAPGGSTTGGVGLQNGLSVEIDDPVQPGAGFVATNNGVQYSVSPGALVITQGSSVLSSEPMLEYWSV
jgi:hypothetical protein